MYVPMYAVKVTTNIGIGCVNAGGAAVVYVPG